MMGKPITGRSFGGCVRYVVNKPQAKVLATEGVRASSANAMIRTLTSGESYGPSWVKRWGTWCSAGTGPMHRS